MQLECSRDAAMRRPVAGEPIGQLNLVDRVRIGRIKAYQHEGADVIRFGGLVRDSATGIVDLLDATGQSRSIVLDRIECLYGGRLCLACRRLR